MVMDQVWLSESEGERDQEGRGREEKEREKEEEVAEREKRWKREGDEGRKIAIEQQHLRKTLRALINLVISEKECCQRGYWPPSNHSCTYT